MTKDNLYPIEKVGQKKDLVVAFTDKDKGSVRFEVRSTLGGFQGHVIPVTSEQKDMLLKMSVPEGKFKEFIKHRESAVTPQIIQNAEFYSFAVGNGPVDNHLPKNGNTIESVKLHPNYADDAQITQQPLPWAVRMTNCTDSVSTPWVRKETVQQLVLDTVADFKHLLDIESSIRSSIYEHSVSSECWKSDGFVSEIVAPNGSAVAQFGADEYALTGEDASAPGIVFDYDDMTAGLLKAGAIDLLANGRSPQVMGGGEFGARISAVEGLSGTSVITNEHDHMHMTYGDEEFTLTHDGDPVVAQAAVKCFERMCQSFFCEEIEFIDNTNAHLVIETNIDCAQKAGAYRYSTDRHLTV